MFVRVVRFTDVTAERMESLLSRIDETGPPPGVPIKKLQLVFDETQGTAVVLQYFDNEENLRAGAETFAAMDPSETPGSRASVDTGELTPAGDLLATVGDLPGLAKLLDRLGVEEESPGVAASAVEFAMEGLYLSRRLNKDGGDGAARYTGADAS